MAALRKRKAAGEQAVSCAAAAAPVQVAKTTSRAFKKKSLKKLWQNDAKGDE